MQQIPTFETALVQLSPATGPDKGYGYGYGQANANANGKSKIPENTIVTILPEESNVWSRADTRS
jgi:hypothetical protein